MAWSMYMLIGMNKNKLITIRAAEEIQEHGSHDKAIEAIIKQIESSDSVKAERAFMRLVIEHIKGLASK